MSNATENIIAASKNELSTNSTEVENIHEAAQEDASAFEKILKFKKGSYYVGEELVPLGTEYLAHVLAWMKCYVKFVGGRVVERKLFHVAKGEKPPEREELDDLDPSKWPEGLDGKPADPWVLQYLLPFENMTSGDVVVFVTSSVGGRRGVSDLCTAWTKRAKKGNRGQPIMKLGKADMPTKMYGPIPRPHFDIIGWDETPGDNASSPPVASEPPPVASEAEFADEIPF